MHGQGRGNAESGALHHLSSHRSKFELQSMVRLVVASRLKPLLHAPARSSAAAISCGNLSRGLCSFRGGSRIVIQTIPNAGLVLGSSRRRIRAMAYNGKQFPTQTQTSQPGKEHEMDPAPRLRPYQGANKLKVPSATAAAACRRGASLLVRRW